MGLDEHVRHSVLKYIMSEDEGDNDDSNDSHDIPSNSNNKNNNNDNLSSSGGSSSGLGANALEDSIVDIVLKDHSSSTFGALIRPYNHLIHLGRTSTNNTTTTTTAAVEPMASYSHNQNNKNADVLEQEQLVQRLTQRDTTSVRIWRMVVVCLILISGGVISWGTYNYSKHHLQAQTEEKFYDFARTIQDGCWMHFDSMFQACRDLAWTITAHARFTTNDTTNGSSNSSSSSSSSSSALPFVTLPNWEVHASSARRHGYLEAITFNPLLPDGEAIQQFNQYAVQHMDEWQDESIHEYQKLNPGSEATQFARVPSNNNDTTFVYKPLRDDPMRTRIPSTGLNGQPALPVWMQSPPPQASSAVLFDMYEYWQDAFNAVIASREMVLGEMDIIIGKSIDAVVGFDAHNLYHAQIDHKAPFSASTDSSSKWHNGNNTNIKKDQNTSTASIQAHGNFYAPVFTSQDTATAEIRGLVAGIFSMDAYLVDTLPNGVRGIRVVIENSCNNSYTYELDGNWPTLLGAGDLSDPRYSHLRLEILFDEILYRNVNSLDWPKGYCSYKFVVTPTYLYMQDNESNIPFAYSITVAFVFGFMVIVFVVYDVHVQRRNKKMIEQAVCSGALVASIFPAPVRDRLMLSDHSVRSYESGSIRAVSIGGPLKLNPTKTNLKSFLMENKDLDEELNDDTEWLLSSKPIADLFTDTTVIFADICGFTAWSSVREPSQVFTLLETIYRAFDLIAKRRGVFKVETVGDCYVAVCGLPQPRKDHAVVMARFARECSNRMLDLTRRLAVQFGPGTEDLGLRVGLHSGPVTAGVLRGERSRFQLFGDTMNTASRMESTGEVNRIHVSEETAKLLADAGKEHWLAAREELVVAKGKGYLSTFWLKKSLNMMSEQHSESCGASLQEKPSESREESDKTARLIGWCTDVLFSLIKLIVVRRNTVLGPRHTSSPTPLLESKLIRTNADKSSTILDEVEEVIELPKPNNNIDNNDENSLRSFEISPDVLEELKLYVAEIAKSYHDNPFHNFHHAAHVCMSVVKLLSRIVAPSEVDYESSDRKEGASSLHDHTYGITSDPLTQFSCVLSALIHDADHPGVPNAQLVKEGHTLAARYGGKSVAEQNSVELAWNMLMEPRFKSLRSVIYTTEDEFKRFRQLVVNSVMATDIVDKELKALRNARWEKAFNSEVAQSGNELENINRKATIVIEHLIQASDVAHTMQHWHVYRKWNERFFCECYQAYCDKRAEKNPAEFWYEGELGFFDFYIIPLAKKLKDCGVFGVSSDEYLNYATRNREQWECTGEDIVETMVEKMNSQKEKPKKKKTGTNHDDL
ncbi:hypothetical protein ACA910_011154 [Epithemia clementina (nom. ined.)]